jgi:hypothetical protein
MRSGGKALRISNIGMMRAVSFKLRPLHSKYPMDSKIGEGEGSKSVWSWWAKHKSRPLPFPSRLCSPQPSHYTDWADEVHMLPMFTYHLFITARQCYQFKFINIILYIMCVYVQGNNGTVQAGVTVSENCLFGHRRISQSMTSSKVGFLRRIEYNWAKQASQRATKELAERQHSRLINVLLWSFDYSNQPLICTKWFLGHSTNCYLLRMFP